MELWDNPIGTDGFEFVEYTGPDPAALHRLFESMGFRAVGKHRSKAVTLYRQGDTNFIVNAEPGRAKQIRAGVNASRANWLLLLYPETELAPSWVGEAQRFMSAPQARKRAAAFRLTLEDDSPNAKRAEFWGRLRAQLMKEPSGAQGLLISRLLYDALGGYPDMAQSGDIEIARRIGRKRLFLLRSEAVTRSL